MTQTSNSTPTSTVTLVPVLKAEEAQSNATEQDWNKEFSALVTGNKLSVVSPPFDPKRMMRMPYENNALGQCVEAMEVNIDGSGYQIVSPADSTVDYKDDEEVKRLMDFFNEPYPQTTFISMRRDLRREMESVGYGFLEVVRSSSGVITMMRHLKVVTMRLLTLGDPIPVTVTLSGGREVKTTMPYRLYVQNTGGSKPVYFKQFGCPADVDKDTGEMSPVGKRLPANKRATEVLMFGVHPYPDSPYFVPRWINQLPSVMGSRKAEEANLDYFEAGGIPAAIVFVSGGVMTPASRDSLTGVLSGRARNQTRGAVVEVHSSSGDINSAGKVDVKVERFGSEQTKDSLYENYDERCEERVRGAFRLPPLFVGKAEDYSFATAYASYVIAESQVFKPERDEFDAILNVTVMREIAKPGYTFESLPMSVSSVEQQLEVTNKALEKNLIGGEAYIRAVNGMTGTTLEYDEAVETEAKEVAQQERDAKNKQMQAAQQGQQQGQQSEVDATGKKPAPTPVEPPSPSNVAKSEEMAELAGDYLRMIGMIPGANMTKSEQDAVMLRIGTLSPEQNTTFYRMVGEGTFGPSMVCPSGCEEIVAAAGELIAHA